MKIKHAVIFFTILIALLGIKSLSEEPNYVEYVVGSGDTLWTIANQSDIDADKRAIVMYMIDKSNIEDSENIQPGMVVQVPMKK